MTQAEIQGRLDLLQENLRKLDLVPQASLQEFRSDFRNVASALYLLQTSIQALVDLAAWASAARALPAARTSHEIFERLEEAGALPPGTTTLTRRVVGFRNRIVHLYDRIDEERVYQILVDHRADLRELADRILAAADLPPAGS